MRHGFIERSDGGRIFVGVVVLAAGRCCRHDRLRCGARAGALARLVNMCGRTLDRRRSTLDADTITGGRRRSCRAR
ncbi:hypothetical protein KCP77_22050 [Salmonella enterica subsp. enterica]|nr:hypothetical protein KCP77_22050 [Salmonella enterica subsp. enterica]